MINFVIPSIARNTLSYTIQSLLDQTDPDWECWVGFDGIEEGKIEEDKLIKDERVHYIYFPEKLGESQHHGNAGLVRNAIISKIQNNRPWIGFVDDDDMLSKYYVEVARLESEYKEFDACVFRMRYDIQNSKIIPPFDVDSIVQNNVGISFFANRKFLQNNNIEFVNDNAEDFRFLKSIEDNGGKVHISFHVMYNVNGYNYCEFQL